MQIQQKFLFKGLMGGGRCTKAGCVCYMAFFDYDGSPTSYYYPEDNIW
jgi:hypothetical protein